MLRDADKILEDLEVQLILGPSVAGASQRGRRRYWPALLGQGRLGGVGRGGTLGPMASVLPLRARISAATNKHEEADMAAPPTALRVCRTLRRVGLEHAKLA
jgi:hypothetical protein